MQNVPVAQPPNAPQAPVTSQGGGGGGGGTNVEVYTPPRTVQEVSALRARRSELSNQLESAEGRRNRLAEASTEADGASKAGLDNRVQLLDQRILQLEADIAQTGRLLATAPSELVASTETPRGMDWLRNDSGPRFEIFFMFLVLPLAIGFARWMWRRATPAAPARDEESAARLVRLEQSVDAIAIEVERISEGQRFITRVFAEGNPSSVAALGAGEAPVEPIRVARDEAVPVSRSSS